MELAGSNRGSSLFIKLGKAIPLLGAGVGAVFDFTTTKVIANRAKKLFGEDGNLNFEALEK